ncbi:MULTISPECIES: oxalurate catabolism protein HpxZ [Nguyenibacter]|uniref:Oxalurate catabolism protein HpxZ n=1 Tax=Nguyenibacter vanlangensis TaxID=1216886 RepID=A0A7Y7M815_9PROT|nr:MULTISPECIES: oxalurate catabolism protein HpxZ [Nguyenibacter]NVN11843.1 oxalurate catabolism protein HpxZ [Nguyenibacter vanlangensis]WRH86973.1 oxalurate catabolism protein HpxZ [Nguyenibacter sp. L1]
MLTIDDPATVAELTEMADRYETALMANDVETLDALFRDAPETIRYGVGEVLYGFAEIAAFRQGRVGGSPQRRVLRRVVTSFGPDLGTVNLEFQREGGTRIGRQSQTWVRTDAGWKITCAHVSLMADIS